MSRADLDALLAFLRELETADDATFAEQVSLGLRSLIPCDGGGFSDVDIGASTVRWFADPADLGEAAELRKQAFEAHMLQHPAIAAFSERGYGRARKLSDFGSARRFRRTDIYNDFYGPLALEHHLVCHWQTGPARYAAMSLFRTSRDFSERDRALLGLARPYLALVQRGAMARTQAQEALGMLDGALEQNHQALLVLADGDRVALGVGRPTELLSSYFADGQGERLPDELARWTRAQRRRLNGEGRPPPLPSVFVKEAGRGTLVAQYLPRGNHHRGDGLLLHERPCARAAIGRGSVGGLTAREIEILQHVAAGQSNRQIAGQLCVTVATVKKHLEHIYRKLGVNSRTAALGKFNTTIPDG